MHWSIKRSEKSSFFGVKTFQTAYDVELEIGVQNNFNFERNFFHVSNLTNALNSSVSSSRRLLCSYISYIAVLLVFYNSKNLNCIGALSFFLRSVDTFS